MYYIIWRYVNVFMYSIDSIYDCVKPVGLIYIMNMERMIALSTQNPLTLLVKFGMMAWNDTTCGNENCSGHGECHNGTCLCEIQFDGLECHVPNTSYYIAFATIFFMLAFVCLIQLIMCIVAEWQKMKAPTFLRACRVTTQKVLYFIVFLASLIRGAYFTSPTAFKEGWSRSLLSAYYPLVLSGSSLIVCFWAEVFHLRDVSWDKPQFLSKSFVGFFVFNVLIYSLLVAEFTTAQIYSQEHQSFYTHVFNGCYAVLLFIVVIFFLIYGVEVYFKIRGGFLNDYENSTILNKRTVADPKINGEEPPEVTAKLFDPVPCSSLSQVQEQINISQLHQSRVGLLSQALMLFIIGGFLCSETLSEFWKTKVPIHSRNWHDVVFRTIEVGAILWFPCVLWNCFSPEQLWILNPKRLLKRLDHNSKYVKEIELQDKSGEQDAALFSDGASISSKDCWICYDSERQDAGPLIQPCLCRGDVSAVHHNCLRRWLVESSINADSLCCKVCGAKYNVEHATRLDWQNSMTSRHCLQTIAIVTTMCGSSAAAWTLIQLVEGPIVRMLAAGTALLVMYVCIRFLSLNTVVAYQRAKISSLNIISSDNNGNAHVSTISHTVCVDLPKSETATI